MAIRILGGLAKGFSLEVSRSNVIRPTSVLLRRRVFDRYQNLSAFYFIDACAGSGAMGLEAWSRGALGVSLIEKDLEVFKTLQKNQQRVETAYAEDFQLREIRLYRMDFFNWYIKNDDAWQSNRIIFFDPPYAEIESFLPLFQKWEQFPGHLWIESDEQKGVPISYWERLGFLVEKSFQQGRSYIAILRRNSGFF